MRYALRLLAIIPPADSRRNPMMKNVRIYIQARRRLNRLSRAGRRARFDTFQYRASDCLSVQSRSG